MAQAAVAIRGLSKAFGPLRAVDDVTLDVAEGEILSLLGPNGAGKTTLISMLAGLERPGGGDATVMGHSVVSEPREAKAVLGIVPQEVALYQDLTVMENLVFWARANGVPRRAVAARARAALEVIGLEDRRRSRVATLSGGMKRRLNIGVALLHEPSVVIMDEPTVGIDPQSRRHILDHVLELNGAGTTIVYTTHYMEEAQELSDHVAIMDQGKLIAYGSQEELVQVVGEHDRVELRLSDAAPLSAEAWRAVPGVSSVTRLDGSWIFLVQDSAATVPHLFEAAARHGAAVTEVSIRKPNLEAVFLHLTGRALRD